MQQQHEEAHVLMWYHSVNRELEDSNIPLSKDAVLKALSPYRTNSFVKLSGVKVDVIMGLLVHLPAAAVCLMSEHLEDRPWDRSALTQKILGDKSLHLRFVPPGCVGQWGKLLQNSEQTCVDLVAAIIQHFTGSFNASLATERAAKKSEIQAARVRDMDIAQLQAACALWNNWLLPTVRQEAPHLESALVVAYKKLDLKDELYRISSAKMSAQSATTLTIHGVTAVAALLKRQTTNLPLDASYTQRIADGQRAEAVQLICRLREIGEAFEAGPECGDEWLPVLA